MKVAASLIALVAVPLALSACTQAQPSRGTMAVAPAVTVTGPAESCIPLRPMSSTPVRDNRTIDFIVSGNRGYRNTLSADCPGLKSGDGFSYETSLSQLCSTDIIHVIENYGGGIHRGASCGLGQFVPVTFER